MRSISREQPYFSDRVQCNWIKCTSIFNLIQNKIYIALLWESFYLNNKSKNVDFIRINKLFGGDLLPTGFFPTQQCWTELSGISGIIILYFITHKIKTEKKTKQNKRKEKSRTVQQIVELRNEFINHWLLNVQTT